MSEKKSLNVVGLDSVYLLADKRKSDHVLLPPTEFEMFELTFARSNSHLLPQMSVVLEMASEDMLDVRRVQVELLKCGALLDASTLLYDRHEDFNAAPSLQDAWNVNLAQRAHSCAVDEQRKRQELKPEEVAESRERRLTVRFLALPYRHQREVASILKVLTEEDGSLPDEGFPVAVFRRAREQGLLAKLWEETEKRHPDPATVNPFEDNKGKEEG